MDESIAALRHSAAHLLAHAIFQLYPDTLFTIGPATETGFFYDVLPKKNFKEQDLLLISERMKLLASQNIPLTHRIVPKAEAEALFSHNQFKKEILATQIKEEVAGIAEQGDFIDLCRGGHVPTTGHLSHFILTGISGSYWRGDRNGIALQRISGMVFFTEEEKEAYLKQREIEERYDHRRLGKELDLFSLQEEGPGFPFIHPKGMIVINQLAAYMRAMTTNAGYQEVRTPTLLSGALWKQSGHYDHYKENMYFVTIDQQEYAIKPMNCPGAFLIFNQRIRTYRELPLRLSEHGGVHRHELSGVLHGMTRVRAFTQDDAHIFCRISQVKEEIILIMNLIDHMLKKTGFTSVTLTVSTRPKKAAGEDHLWESAINSLKEALQFLEKPYHIKEGDGAFYGPKIEVEIKDTLGRSWTCGTIQVDFVQPVNFALSYINEKGESERPVVIHQAMYGSFERFFAILLEHHHGVLPFWLAPVQGRVIPITDEQRAYGESVVLSLKKKGIRVELDDENAPLAAKIQKAQRERIPHMIILGKRECENRSITVRSFEGVSKEYRSMEEYSTALDSLI